MTSASRPTVLYLVAKGRSGSNILAHCLGQVDGIENTGELFQFWRRAQEPDVLCGCGAPIRDCPLWGGVIGTEAVTGGAPDAVADQQDRILSWRFLPRLLLGRGGTPDSVPLDPYLARRAALYERIVDLTGSKVVLDASKWPWDPAVLGLVPHVDVRVLHVVRDPRAVAHSWQRHKDWGDRLGRTDAMPRFRASYSAASWLGRNLVSEYVHRRRPQVPWLRVRYEDFVTEPKRVFDEILAFLDLDGASTPLAGPSTIHMRPTHGVAGNASKFQVGDVQLRLDDEWRTKASRWERVASTAISAPLLRRYGYELAP